MPRKPLVTPQPIDPLADLLADVESAFRSGRYLVIVARIETDPRTNQNVIRSRHHTRDFKGTGNMVAADFEAAVRTERAQFLKLGR